MTDPIIVLYRGGRLPGWHHLQAAQRAAYQDEHVALTLEVGAAHGLLAPMDNWERWWTMRFADLGGAEAWMQSEIAPPYGRYGFYSYTLAPSWRPQSLAWLPRQPAPTPAGGTDPHQVPVLSAARGSIVVIAFGGWSPGSDTISPASRGDAERQRRLQLVAREHGLLHGELFRPLGPGPDGEIVWLVEFPTLSGAEAWIGAGTLPPAGSCQRRTTSLPSPTGYRECSWPPGRKCPSRCDPAAAPGRRRPLRNHSFPFR